MTRQPKPVTVRRRLTLPIGAPPEKRANTMRWLRELVMHQALAGLEPLDQGVTYSLRFEQRVEEKSTGVLLELAVHVGRLEA